MQKLNPLKFKFLANLKFGTHPIVMSTVGKGGVWNMRLTEPLHDAAVLTGSCLKLLGWLQNPSIGGEAGGSRPVGKVTG